MKNQHARRGYTQQEGAVNKNCHSVLDTESSMLAVVSQALPDNVCGQASASQKRNFFLHPLTCPPGILSLQGEEHSVSECPSPSRGKVGEARMRGHSLGFTLIEILVVVLIIGILGAIALPQYQRALLKSRYAALMPIAKSMANSNEAYYLEHGIYADDPQDLLIQGQSRYTDDTELEFGTVSDYAYVLAKNEDKIPNNTFVVYQKHSGEFPGEIHCEALANNDLAESVCKSFGGNESIGKTLTNGYETYVLFGTGNGVAPSGDEGGNDEPETPTCEGVSCDDDGNITECASGQTLNNGSCEECATAFPGASACSTTAYKPTACSEGYTLNAAGTACVSAPLIPARGAVKSGYPTCTTSGSDTNCTYKYEDGSSMIYQDHPTSKSWHSCKEDGVCSSSSTVGDGYEFIQLSTPSSQWYVSEFDNEGIFQGGEATFSSGGATFHYDAAGLIGVSHSNGVYISGKSYTAYYDVDGNLLQLNRNFGSEKYVFDKNGVFLPERSTSSQSPIDATSYKMSATDLAQGRDLGASLVGKTKCQVFPELQGC